MASSKGSMVKNNDVFLDDDWDTNSVNNIPSHDFIELMALWTKLYGGEPSGICDHIFSSISISMQYAVQISASNYIPVEMALVHYSWNSGTLDSKFYRLIKPDCNGMPQGFMAEARAHSEATHKIEFGGEPDATANYAQILTELYEHLSWIDKKAFVFCLEKELEIAQSGLRYLEKHAKNITIKPITILKTEELFMALHWWARHGRKKMYPLPEQISHEKERIKECLTRSLYDFTSSIRCTFHQKRDLGCCALSKASLTWMHLDDYLELIGCKIKPPEKVEKPIINTAMTLLTTPDLTTLNLPPTTTPISNRPSSNAPLCLLNVVGVPVSRGGIKYRTVRLVFHDERCVGAYFLNRVVAILRSLNYRPQRSTLLVRDAAYIFVDFQAFEIANFVVNNICHFANQLSFEFTDLDWTIDASTTSFEHWKVQLNDVAGECRSIPAEKCGKGSTLRRNLQRLRKTIMRTEMSSSAAKFNDDENDSDSSVDFSYQINSNFADTQTRNDGQGCSHFNE